MSTSLSAGSSEKISSNGHVSKEQFEAARKGIDSINAELVALLVERARYAQIIGRFKHEHGKPTRDREREAVVLKKAGTMCQLGNPDLHLFMLLAFRGIINAHVVLEGDVQPPEGPLRCETCGWVTQGLFTETFNWPICPRCQMPLSAK